ncbi:MAG: MarC family protein [Gammaproteobacteria bacterium]|nr:MarC family protein [Gammaproteobacteria bacterium]
MCVVVWAGLPLLSFLGISLSSFKLAGGLIVVLSGLQMIQAKNVDRKSLSEQGMIEKESPAVVPLATPLIAGPGAISTIMAHLGEGHAVQSRIEGTIICVIVGLIVGLFLWFSPAISKWIGRNGLRVTSQLMGLILMSIAFQMITSGLADVFPAIAK